MKRFKKIMLGALSVLTLGLFVVTGARVDAETVEVKNIDAHDLYSSGSIAKYDDKTKCTTLGTYDVLTISQTSNYVQKMYDADNATPYISNKNSSEITATTYGFSFGKSGSITIGLEENQTATVNISLFSRSAKSLKTKASGGKNLFTFGESESITDGYNYTISEKTASSNTNVLALETLYDVTITDLDSENNVLYFDGAYGIGFTKMSITITTATVKSNAELISEAETAIEAIGTVTYTPESKALIDAATAAIDLCENGIDDIDSNLKTVYETAVNTYNDLVQAAYDALSKSFSTNDDETITSTEVTLTEKQQLGNSIFTATAGMKKKDAANLTIGNTSWNTRYYTGGNSVIESGKAVSRAFYFDAKTSGTLKIAATGQNATDTLRSVELFNESFEMIGEKPAQLSDTQNSYIYFDVPSAGTYYIGSHQGVNFFYLEFIPNTTKNANDVNLVVSAQSNAEELADSSKLRLIGEIRGVEYTKAYEIEKIEFTFIFNGKDRVFEVANLYKSIKSNGEVLLPPAEKTMYVVYQLNNINKTAYQGLIISNIKFIVTFKDGSTACGNHVNITLPDAFSEVVA